MSIHRLIDAEEIPAFRVGRSIRIPTKAVWEYLETNRVQAPFPVTKALPSPALPVRSAS